MAKRALSAVAVIGSFACVLNAMGTVVITTVNVGNTGNAADSTGFGTVAYEYGIGRNEITAAQYAEFLNSVAATDTYSLYNASMASTTRGCKIVRSGASGSYTYSVTAGYEDRPVNYVSWGDAARFANWMHNGQPTGAQGLGTTEDGSYFLNGVADASLSTVSRSANATWVIPSEDEWYKSAYHMNDGATGNYFLYGTSSNAQPGKVLADPFPGNNANYGPNPAAPIDGIYWTTLVGQFANSASPYGTYDQSGNIREWTEGRPATGNMRYARGGSFFENAAAMQAVTRGTLAAGGGGQDYVGFRMGYVPAPSASTLLAIGCIGLARRRR